MNEIKDVVVTNYQELLAAIRPFQPGGTSIREELIRGFDLIKERKEVWVKTTKEVDDAAFGAHKPASMANPDSIRFWLDSIVERRMGGKRCGMSVIWNLEGKTYTFDPYSGGLCSK